MSEYPWNEKNNTFTWLSSLYNPFKTINMYTFSTATTTTTTTTTTATTTTTTNIMFCMQGGLF